MSLRDAYPEAGKPPGLDLGSGVTLQFTMRYNAPDDADYCGALVEHPAPTETGRCMGSIFFHGRGMDGKAEWDILSEVPLTLSPSLLCSCGFHGFVRDGKWVGA